MSTTETIKIKNVSGAAISKVNLSVMPRAFGELTSIYFVVASRPTPKLRLGSCATLSRSQRGLLSSGWPDGLGT